MYNYISGKIVELTPSHLVIDNNGIGYFMRISLASYSKFSKEKTNTKVYIEPVFREDSHNLFGFFDVRERRMFQLLVTVSGVGSNTAIMILSSLEYPEIQKSILHGDVDSLKSVKGIGVKTAQRIIVDLKDKIGDSAKYDSSLHHLHGPNKERDEALSALLMLGFSKNQTEKILNKILQKEKNLTVEMLIKKALKHI